MKLGAGEAGPEAKGVDRGPAGKAGVLRCKVVIPADYNAEVIDWGELEPKTFAIAFGELWLGCGHAAKVLAGPGIAGVEDDPTAVER